MNRFIFVFGLIILVFLTSLSLAGIPKMINYQGMLTDNSGNPLTDTVSITFKIYDNSSGGNKKWEETQSSVPVINGLFNVILGNVTPIDTLSFNQDYWLDITVGAEQMPTRLKFTSVGYAYRAQNADTAEYARIGGGGSGSPWVFRITDGGDTTITTGGRWGIARQGNTLYGNTDSTHVNLGVACVTGTNGINYKYCTVGGGTVNVATGPCATVGGGGYNWAGQYDATVGGGGGNGATGIAATVGGGYLNTASGDSATVAGGDSNVASGLCASVGGGDNNTASGYNSTVGGGYQNTASESYATVGGGNLNAASGDNATVGGGYQNTASGFLATVAGGANDTASGSNAIVGGGYQNTASESYATIGGGWRNTASGMSATVGGGYDNTASGYNSTVGGGFQNIASGDYSAIPGGHLDTLTSSGEYSMIFGRSVYVNNAYRVVFFDGSYSGGLGINRDDRNGGISYPIHVGTNTGNGNGAYLTAGGVWTNGSSRTFKEKFQPLDSQKLLEKISSLPVEAWNFKNSEERHIGPVAEDFVLAFDVGTVREDGARDNKYLSTEDIAGVSLVAIQELSRIVKEQQKEIEALKDQIKTLQVR